MDLLTAILDRLPRRTQGPVLGALILAAFVSSVYAIGTYAADVKLAPVVTRFDRHADEQKKREEYDRELKEAIWIDLQALCSSTGAPCHPPPIPK
jgi:hypothetical protein